MSEKNAFGLALLNEWDHTINMLAQSIREFSPEQWTKATSDFQTPARNAYHNVECIDYFFRDDPHAEYPWGHHFGTGKIWGLPAEELPKPEQLLAYLEELRTKVTAVLTPLDAAALTAPWGKSPTRLQFLVYALRHTVRHQGELNMLSVLYGNEPENWE